jgi:hypothetical protein
MGIFGSAATGVDLFNIAGVVEAVNADISPHFNDFLNFLVCPALTS